MGEQPAIGLSTESAVAVRLERVTIPNSAWAGIEVSRGTLDLREVSISNTGNHSIRIPGSYVGTVSGTVADSNLESIWYAGDQMRITWRGNTFENWGAPSLRIGLSDAGAFTTGNTFHGVAGAHLRVCGYTITLSKDTTWGPAAGPLVLQTEYNNIAIEGTDGLDGVTTLTILPGTTVAFSGSTKSLRIGSGAPGALIADGDAPGGPAPIRFTSAAANPVRGVGAACTSDRLPNLPCCATSSSSTGGRRRGGYSRLTRPRP